MAETKHILLFGAGKSATVLIDYLKKNAIENNWQLTVADSNYELAASKTGIHESVIPVQVNIENAEERKSLIEKADLVISMMPASLHQFVAMSCIEFEKHLFTASYVDEGIKGLEEKIKNKNLFFLCEMGLDPGIDHMSAMQIFHKIEKEGGTVTSFKSHCGGLVAPESDDNPWHYKISWNPRNIILAGKAGAVYRENGEEKHLAYNELFSGDRLVQVPGDEVYAYYPNRDSLSYAPLYGLQNTHTFVRTTLRHPDFCTGWKMIVDLKLTDEEKLYETDGLTVAAFFKIHFKKIGFDKIDDSNPAYKQFVFLGLTDETFINKGLCSAADVLQFIVERKLALQPHDKDMIVMLHEIGYKKNNIQHEIKSSLIVKGEDSLHTAMAKTVGLPLGIAAKLFLEGKINETGLHIPIIPSIYEPVLEELKKFDIVFNETEN